ncbi:MAG: hypothetical protein GC157_07205 [Frankiales bacterium]|nr:hypothetical protein [Frankiales bacterium]
MSYQDELSVKLSAKDELSAKLKAVRKETTAVEKAMVAARREIEQTGSPQAVAELKRLESEYGRLARSQRELAKSSSQVKRDLDQIKSKAAGTTSSLDRLGGAIVKRQKEIQRTGVVMAAAFAYFSKQSLQQFSLVEDAASALSATFGQTGDDMISWAKSSGDALNLSQAQALDALMTFSGYARTAGLEDQKLASFSEKLVARSADLASYYGGTTADAIQAIGAALRGEAEPARRYQIFVDDLALKQEYLALTGQKVTGTLTAQQKVLAASSLIMKQSAVAQGDLARTADSTANILKDSSQQWEDFQSSAGKTVALVFTPMLTVGNHVLGMLATMPEPLQQTAYFVTALGIVAMIATPRLIAMHTALKGIGVSIKALGPVAAILIGGAEATLQAYDAGEKLNDGQKSLGDTMAENNAGIGWLAIGFANARTVIDKLTGSTADATEVTNDNATATLTAAQAAQKATRADEAQARSLRAVAWGERSLAAAHLSAAAAASIQAAAENRLTGALGKAERMLARREAMRSYRQAMRDFVKKPSIEAGDALDSAMLNVANTYKDPERRAKFVKRSYKDIETAVKGSNLPANIKSKVTKPLRDANIEARVLLNTMRAIDAGLTNHVSVGNAFNTPIAKEKRAAGGLVLGPGTGTSDSIPALLSNGEYVIRAAAARMIGYDTLTRLNHADRMPSLPAIVTAAPTITLPATPIGRDAPLVGSMVVHAAGQVDVDLSLMRLHRQQERDRRTRTAGTR